MTALHPIMAQALAPFAPANSSVHQRVTLHREINALGGVPSGPYEAGYNTAIGDVLAILERRGFTEATEARPC